MCDGMRRAQKFHRRRKYLKYFCLCDTHIFFRGFLIIVYSSSLVHLSLFIEKGSLGARAAAHISREKIFFFCVRRLIFD